MMAAAERYRELITDFEAYRSFQEELDLPHNRTGLTSVEMCAFHSEVSIQPLETPTNSLAITSLRK